jgi:hydrogenase/urease accessory protein HupE
MKRLVALGQGGYYVATGVWPLVSLATFEAVSGPKVEDWLVRTVGVLVTVIGLVLLTAGVTNQITAPVRLLAVGSAAGLAFIDFFYAMRGVIWPVYILDGVGEIILIGLWVAAIFRDRVHTSTAARQPLTN